MALLPTNIIAGNTGHVGHSNQVHTKLNQVIDARADFGATGDGTADDTAELQAAFDAVPTGGGVVFIPPGRYKVTAPLVVSKDNVTVIGAGPGHYSGGSGFASTIAIGTVIVAGTGFTGTSVLQLQHSGNTRPLYGSSVQEFTVDAANIAARAIHHRSWRSHNSNVAAMRATEADWYIEGYAAWASNDTNFYKCVAREGAVGFRLPAGSRAEDLHFVNCIAASCTSHGMHNGCASQQIIGCHFWDCNGAGYYQDGGARTKILGCKIEGHDLGGIVIVTGSHEVIVGNGFKDNSRATTNVADHIEINGTAGISKLTIVGNAMHSTIANKPRYGINLANTFSTQSVIADNQLGDPADYGTASINGPGATAAGFRNVIRDNHGYKTENAGTATITSGTTAVTVTHGMGHSGDLLTPRANEISVTATNNPTTDPGHIWVSGITSTQFVINCRTDPGASGLSLGWRVQHLSEVA